MKDLEHKGFASADDTKPKKNESSSAPTDSDKTNKGHDGDETKKPLKDDYETKKQSSELLPDIVMPTRDLANRNAQRIHEIVADKEDNDAANKKLQANFDALKKDYDDMRKQVTKMNKLMRQRVKALENTDEQIKGKMNDMIKTDA